MKKFLLLFLLMAAPAFAIDSKPTTIQFRNGESYIFTPFDMGSSGNVSYHVTHKGKPVKIEYFDGKNLGEDDEIGCVELNYDVATDRLNCPGPSAYKWYANTYRAVGDRMVLEKVTETTFEEPPANHPNGPSDVKTTVIYNRKY